MAYYHPRPPDPRIRFAVRLGVQYTVFDITCAHPFPIVGIADEKHEIELLYPTPMCLFEITDAGLPSNWVARVRRDGILTLEPASFYDSFYEDLADGKREAIDIFHRVRAELEGATSRQR